MRTLFRWILVAVCGYCVGMTTLSAADTPLTWKDDAHAGTTDLLWGDAPVLRYMYDYLPATPETLHDTYKVYHHVFDPVTGTRLTKGPGGQFTHHRGIFLAWNKTGYEGKSDDFWHCTKGAHQRHIKFLKLEAGTEQKPLTAEFVAEIGWNDADGKPVIIEQRGLTITLTPGDNGAFTTQIDVRSTLNSQRGPITLEGDRQHAGLQYRADQSVAVANSATYIRPANFPQEPKAIEVGDADNPPRHSNLGWFAMTYPLAEKTYTVEYLEDPALPKPSLFSERPYGRFGAFFKTAIDTDKPLTLNYRFFIRGGTPPTSAEIQQRYEAFTAELQAK